MSAEMLREADFSIALSNALAGQCSANGCRTEPTLYVTVTYCFCDQHADDDEAHPNSTDPSATRYEVPICERHGALIAHTWDAFEALRNVRAT